jgi:uncharacterized protein with HEPN domain
MQEANLAIENYTHGISFKRFCKDQMRVDAVVRNLEIIGEAAKNIPDVVREQYPAIEWRKITGLRDIVAHQYFNVDLEIVWDVVQHKLPALRQLVASILRQER